MDKRKGAVILKGVVLPATDEPDLDRHVFDLDGVRWADGPLPLHWDVWGGEIGEVVLERTAQGIFGVATACEDRRLQAMDPDIAFGLEGMIEKSETLPDGTRRILAATITGVSVLPSKLAITRGTGVSIQDRKEEP